MEMESRKIQQALVVVINRPPQPKIIEDKTPAKMVIERKDTKSDIGDND